MKVIYFDQYYLPEKASGIHLVQDLLDGMAEKGWEVDVYVPVPTRGVSACVRRIYKHKKIETTREGRVTIHRMSLMSEGTSPALRALRFAIFSFKCFIKALTARYDVAFTGSGPPTQGCVLGIACRIKGKPLVYNLQDVFPDSLVTTGLVREGSLPWRIGRRIEDSSYKRASRIIAISERMRSNILAKGADSEKVTVVMNWEDLETVHHIDKNKNGLFKELRIDSRLFTVVYAGNLGASQDMDSFLRLARSSEEMPIQFVIMGSGTEEGRLRERATTLGLENVIFRPLQPLDRVAEVYSMGDLAYISCVKGVGKAGFPSKAWSIFAAGTPVLASFDIDSDLGDAITGESLGLISEPDDDEALFSNLCRLYENEQMRSKSGKNARAFVEKNGDKRRSVEGYLRVMADVVYEGVDCGK